jgi:predicted nucleotide-binding protein
LDPRQVEQQFGSPPLVKLRAFVEDGLIRTFGEDTIEYKRYKNAASFHTGPVFVGHETPLHEVQEAVAESRNSSIALWEQAIESLEEQLVEAPQAVAGGPSPAAESARQHSDRVFIVHGHEAESREAVARFVAQIGLDPIILHEQPNEGRTVIEKFEAHGDVSFAIILLTPDDLGGSAEGELELRSRARQNVILELGYFIGRLGRKHVCALKRGDIEIPSDYLGVVYHEIDAAGAWRVALAKELQAVGHDIDWNKAMRG